MDHSAAPNGANAFRFTGEGACDRMAAIQGILDRWIWRFDFEPHPDAPFFSEGRMIALPGLALSEIATSPGRTRRTARHLVDDQCLLSICVAGSSAVSQCGRETMIGEGSAALTTGAESATLDFSRSRFLSLRAPVKAIKALVPDVEDRLARPIAADTEALKLLLGYAGALCGAPSLATPQTRHIAVTHVHDLMALVIGAASDGAEVAKGRGLRAARLQAIKADIENELGQDLSLAVLAARHRLPLRYVRRLFEEEGTTFTEFVLSRRLARAHRMLLNPRAVNLKISTVAAEAGFNNLSYFNEAFRRRYDVTPSDVRAQVANCGDDHSPRSRMSITRHKNPVHPGRPIISRVVEHGDRVYVCGILPDPVGDISTQTRQVLDRIDEALALANTGKSRLRPRRSGLQTCACSRRTMRCGTLGLIRRTRLSVLACALTWSATALSKSWSPRRSRHGGLCALRPRTDQGGGVAAIGTVGFLRSPSILRWK